MGLGFRSHWSSNYIIEHKRRSTSNQNASCGSNFLTYSFLKKKSATFFAKSFLIHGHDLKNNTNWSFVTTLDFGPIYVTKFESYKRRKEERVKSHKNQPCIQGSSKTHLLLHSLKLSIKSSSPSPPVPSAFSSIRKVMKFY